MRDQGGLSPGVTLEAAGSSAEHKSVWKVEPIGLVDKLGVGERERERGESLRPHVLAWTTRRMQPRAPEMGEIVSRRV